MKEDFAGPSRTGRQDPLTSGRGGAGEPVAPPRCSSIRVTVPDVPLADDRLSRAHPGSRVRSYLAWMSIRRGLVRRLVARQFSGDRRPRLALRRNVQMKFMFIVKSAHSMAPSPAL